VNETEVNFTGVVRKQLGLTFLGEIRDDFRTVTGDIRLTSAGLDRVVRPFLIRWKFLIKSLSIGTVLEVQITYRMCPFYPGRYILTTHSVSLRPTDEISEDGWQFSIHGPELDTTKIALSEELIFETIASMVPTEITFNKLVWVSEFRCVRVISIRVYCVHQSPLGPISAW